MAASKKSDLPYIVALEDDLIVCQLLEDIIGLKVFSFATASGVVAKSKMLDPVGLFVDIHLASDECGLDVIPALKRT